jgi:hypothetical protein
MGCPGAQGRARRKIRRARGEIFLVSLIFLFYDFLIVWGSRGHKECGTPWNSLELLGTPCSSLELPAIHKNSLELPRTPSNSLEFQGPGGQVFYGISSHWEGASRDPPPSILALLSFRMEDYLRYMVLADPSDTRLAVCCRLP